MTKIVDVFAVDKHQVHQFQGPTELHGGEHRNPVINKCVDTRCPPDSCKKGFTKATEAEVDAYLAS